MAIVYQSIDSFDTFYTSNISTFLESKDALFTHL